MLAVLGYVAIGVAAVSIAGHLPAWLAVRRVYGRIPVSLVLQMLAYARRAPAARLAHGLGWVVTAWLGVEAAHAAGYLAEPPRLLLVGAALFLADGLATCALPPSVLFLASSDPKGVAALSRLCEGLWPRRAVALLRPATDWPDPATRGWFFLGCLRTGNTHEWRSEVFHLMDVVPLIVIDLSAGTDGLDEEWTRLVAKGYLGRTVQLAGPLEPGQAQGRARERRVVRLAAAAVRGFQQLHMPPRIEGGGGSYAFDQGPVRFFVLDTRGQRDPQTRSVLSAAALNALREWFHHPEAALRLNCIVSGSVLLPRLAPGNNPANPGEDTIAWSPKDRQALLALLGTAGSGAMPRRFLLLSGDYHLSTALTIDVGSQTLGAAVVAPPLYAPLTYTNVTHDALWLDEDLSAHGLTMHAVDSWEGSGFAALNVRREARGGWHITLQQWLHDHAAGAAQGAVVGPVSIRLD
jgi:hypothetical protein